MSTGGDKFMNMKQLETFYWIDRLGSFSAAADRVFATQSTVSMRIQELEDSFGVKLFDRSQRTAKLTSKGKELVPYVKQLIELTSEMQQLLMPKEGLSGLIRLGVVEVIATTWLTDFIKHLRNKYPQVKLEIEVGLANELNEKLLNGDLDLIFSMGRAPGNTYAMESLGTVALDWMCAPELLGKKSKATIDIFNEQPLILLNKNSFHYKTIQVWMKENEVKSKSVIECNSMSAIAALLKAGIGVSLLPGSCFSRELSESALKIFKIGKEFKPAESFAMYISDSPNPIAQAVAEIGAEISRCFDDGAEDLLKNKPELARV